MALSILDGTQTATTLSTILSSGQHITAHTVVSLGTQAITDMRGAVSGSVVSISNFPATQPISGSVTIGNSVTISSLPAISGTVTASVSNFASIATDIGGNAPPIGIQLGFSAGEGEEDFRHVTSTSPLPISGTVTANPTGTQTIAGTVTAGGRWFDGTTYVPTPFMVTEDGALETTSVLVQPIPAGTNRIGVVTIGGGTVTIGAGTAQIGSVTASLAISSSAITSGSFASLTSATLVPGNVARKMATVYNLGAGQLFVNAGSSASTLGGGFMVALSSGDFYECDYTTTTLSAIFATAGTASWVSH